jgi:hypothetical protein
MGPPLTESPGQCQVFERKRMGSRNWPTQPCVAGAACSERATRSGGLASGAGQINCGALRLSRGKPASSLTRHKANCTARVIPRARPRGGAPTPIQDLRLQGQVTTATPFRSSDGHRARSLRASSVDTSGPPASSHFRRLRVASESALEARLSSGFAGKQGGLRACGMQKWPLVPVLNRPARHALDARIFSVTVVTLRSRMEPQGRPLELLQCHSSVTSVTPWLPLE